MFVCSFESNSGDDIPLSQFSSLSSSNWFCTEVVGGVVAVLLQFDGFGFSAIVKLICEITD